MVDEDGPSTRRPGLIEQKYPNEFVSISIFCLSGIKRVSLVLVSPLFQGLVHGRILVAQSKILYFQTTQGPYSANFRSS